MKKPLDNRSLRDASGFTLVEAVMVIVITGILAAMVAVFITSPVQGYLDSVRRAELTDTADGALRRLVRDVRLALPNSLRTASSGGVNYIEFIMTSTGGRYRDATDGSKSGNFLYASGSATFDALGMPTNTTPAISPGEIINPGDYVVVYNLGENYDPGNAYTGGNRAQVAAGPPVCPGAPQPCTFTLTGNPFPGQTPPLPSPGSRFQVVPGGVKAVMFACPSASPGPFYRYSNYGSGFHSTINDSIAALSGTPPLMATNSTCTVSYSPSTALGRNGLLSITLKLYDPQGSGESVELFRQIHVDNSP
ncbi:MAG: type II secretion system protein [Betaproteobacteria bacterium]|nr:type II secretion system protein [Betaproteobacteria bacterium]